MKIIVKCLKCESVIRDMNIQTEKYHDKPITENDLEDITREAQEMNNAGFLKLWCNACNCRVDFETERVK